jgi:8-oxo-dGTP diphosphatase
MDLPHTLAAGGIVVRHDSVPRIAVVRLRKTKAWVLPKGKLDGDETALAAARREVLEETGHQVSVHEFVGALTYPVRGKPKVVQFWRMQAIGGPARKLMRDVSAVEFLPLRDAILRLTRPHERIFLENIGPAVLRAIAEQERRRIAKKRRRALESKKPPRKVRLARSKLQPGRGTAPIDAGREAEPIAAKRPWLRRYVLDRLLGRESLGG